ncbi:Ltp family lipoprotein [Curtobacterium flaccumfaciens pv. oortii]|uniref:Ltp family lipoprotein n=1 Tax=Curtobacterium flaccumfaciens TaxID=2035 RepID=UPI00265B67B7|nr:Ltp family lipoprotein [Curtobacterium flaccumfaciens]MCS5521203.1 Ltp family lipoprotein [Curtobacterium flaccumfaciens pv. oortii]
MSIPTSNLQQPAPSDPHPIAAKQGGAALGATALWLGIFGIVLAVTPHVSDVGVFLGVVGVILGIIGIRRRGRRVVAGTVVAAVAVLIGGIFSGVYGGNAADSAAPPAATTSARSVSATPAPTPAGEQPAKQAKPEQPAGSASQLQALSAAEGYLSSGIGFSQASLLSQLTNEAGNGFPAADAQWAIDHAKPDWNAQALSAATGYLTSGIGFSAASLSAQLTSSSGNQFTPEQAQYAVAHAHADWSAQAVLAAKGYVSSGIGFSRSSLIDQLTSSAGNQFTPDQAQYAADQVGLK